MTAGSADPLCPRVSGTADISHKHMSRSLGMRALTVTILPDSVKAPKDSVILLPDILTTVG